METIYIEDFILDLTNGGEDANPAYVYIEVTTRTKNSFKIYLEWLTFSSRYSINGEFMEVIVSNVDLKEAKEISILLFDFKRKFIIKENNVEFLFE